MVNEGQLLLLIVASLAITAVCRHRDWPAPLVLVAVGLAVSAVPGFPEVEVDGDVVLALVLPPLLYSAALRCSYTGFRANLGPITALGVGMVAVTTAVVGFVAYSLVSDMPLAVAFVLGAVVAPPDAVAATAVAKRLGLPRRVVMILTGESLINDATALTLYRVALGAALGATTGALHGLAEFAWTTVAGIAVGLVMAVAVNALRRWVRDPVLETALGLVVPFAAYLAGEEIGASGVLAVVAAGLFAGRQLPRMGFASRLQEEPVWEALDTLLEALVFGLIGIQLRFVVAAVADSAYDTGAVVLAGFVVLVTVIAVRFAGVFALGFAVRAAQARGKARRLPPPELRYLTVVSWAGMRGVVTLAVAAAIPLTTDSGDPFPDRPVVQLIAFVVTIGTLLLQGLTLPMLIRRLHAQAPWEREEDARAESHIHELTTEAALERLEALRATWPPDQLATLDRLATAVRTQGDAAIAAAQARLEELEEEEGRREAAALAGALRDARADLIAIQRQVLLAERDAGAIDEDVMRDVLHSLDLQEAALGPPVGVDDVSPGEPRSST